MKRESNKQTVWVEVQARNNEMATPGGIGVRCNTSTSAGIQYMHHLSQLSTGEGSYQLLCGLRLASDIGLRAFVAWHQNMEYHMSR